ncbi:Uma2 family endonuclease [Microcoleus sp. CAWBG58]|uniref:Uma2 family endonuclease n=1 Tax=Microcoleus sp. CAWBG58 TaxID=2841651 RepID=UPI0025D43012|nr:Uma2 family endonuclease [Microcoleus sp. CAWBG58]
MTQTLSKPVETKTKYTITWEKLPEDFILPDDPVENIDQPLLAAALRESLELAGFILASMLIASNFGLCATVNDKTIVKAPDWVYISSVLPAEPGEVRRSYTLNAEGEVPAVVMEFLSDTNGSEYSTKPTYPYGKWRFYERILQVPVYVIFEPKSGDLEVYRLVSGQYELQENDANGRFWIESMNLFLGVWEGEKSQRRGYWLRWWDENGNLLLWGAERVEQEQQRADEERQRADEERQRADEERQRADRLMAYLISQGIDPDAI